MVAVYFLSSPDSDQDLSDPYLDGDVYIESVLYSVNVPEPDLKPGFAVLFPDHITGTRRVKLLMDPMNEETEGRFASKVVDQANVLYISDSIWTDFEIEYSVYEMESPYAASQVLDYYTTQMKWNTIPKQFGNVTFWLWPGYEENARRPYDMDIYWDTANNGAFLPINRQGEYYITRSSDELMCLHGESVKDKYFIMVDIHAAKWKVNDFGEYYFAEASARMDSQIP